ncbi:GAF domain-containing protein [Natrialba sp. SSL1]|uniref:GAF domain-containing protein n=1 Tax=Natrialba sp. SSL1 TaxID=1869245 RepID=UPI000A01EC57|nr:GAF domain-containing protein [Natrialba sp. SSL1]
MDDSHQQPSAELQSADKMRDQLQEIIDEFDCTSGTLHRLEDDTLELVAAVGIPDPVLERIGSIPIGKGMAGLAAERMEPVDVCNLQTDDSGVAEAGARKTGMEGSLAAPLLGPERTLEGTIGVAKPEQYEFTDRERERLLERGTELTRQL